MKNKLTAKELLTKLHNEKIHTWFDLGLFIDRFKEENNVPTAEFKGTYEEFRNRIDKSGMAFITFGYSVDGVTIEIEKYSKIFRQNFENIDIHYIGGEFLPESDKLIDPRTKKFVIDEAKAFNDWSLYNDFFLNNSIVLSANSSTSSSFTLIA